MPTDVIRARIVKLGLSPKAERVDRRMLLYAISLVRKKLIVSSKKVGQRRRNFRAETILKRGFEEHDQSLVNATKWSPRRVVS